MEEFQIYTYLKLCAVHLNSNEIQTSSSGLLIFLVASVKSVKNLNLFPV